MGILSVFIVPSANLFSKLLIQRSLHAEAPLCEAQSFPRMENAGKCKYNADSILRKQFSGKRIRKTLG